MSIELLASHNILVAGSLEACPSSRRSAPRRHVTKPGYGVESKARAAGPPNARPSASGKVGLWSKEAQEPHRQACRDAKPI